MKMNLCILVAIFLFPLLFLFTSYIRLRRRTDIRYGRRKAPSVKPVCFRNATKPEWVRTEIIRLKALMPDAGCRRLADCFNRQYAHKNMTIGKTYVSGIIRKHMYEIQVARHKIRNRKLKPSMRNRVWGLDLTGKTDSDGHTHPILGIVDHGSRANLTLMGLKSKATIIVLRALLDVIERFSKPQQLRTDNERIFTSHLFRFGLWALGIKHQLTDPHCPWQNGRIERFFGTLKKKLDHWAVENLDQLNTALHVFRLWYNHIRPHQQQR